MVFPVGGFIDRSLYHLGHWIVKGSCSMTLDTILVALSLCGSSSTLDVGKAGLPPLVRINQGFRRERGQATLIPLMCQDFRFFRNADTTDRRYSPTTSTGWFPALPNT